MLRNASRFHYQIVKVINSIDHLVDGIATVVTDLLFIFISK